MAHTECGIVGLPNVGKSGLFNALTGAQVASCNYPFCTIDPNIGIVPVIDDRLDTLAKISHSQKVIYADMKFVDIAGLVKGASDGAGLGNRFLSHIRETHAIAHVVRCFENDDITHVSGKIDPEEDINVINLELIFSDFSSATSIYSKLSKLSKGKKEEGQVLLTLDKVIAHLEKEQPVRTLNLSLEEKTLLKPYPLLTSKPMLYVANISESSIGSDDNAYVSIVRRIAEKERAQVVPICVQIEEEIMSLPEDERHDFLISLGLEESGLNRLVCSAYNTLGLISYFTTGPQETRAWTIPTGSTAAEAAGQIHSDIQKGFIRAEVITLEDMIAHQGRLGVREAGKLRSEGRDYIVQDGDIILFLHN
ncbi:GTP-dependent nucleic acid-binding protein engD [Chlamydia ibidis]|uniref:Ribosome-binding ATPase YchF n=2 Tax=Chlamydia ibidis TaxID=1405396 RepID=S7KHL2_9CHLA|nr:redox-regulated ATPase YchF [Chlamydia ibidis]EPP35656.1 GTP-dependent nucleic acid-binding protein engD [Chlamydia ibidis]EQM62519.1 GTP Binding Protein [Chlamydia ibidis 10-1398/6]